MRFLILAILFIPQFLNANIVINEFLASNGSINRDPDYNEYSDWIELYNSGNSDVSLAGYYLTDDPASPRKWQIPANVVIRSKSYVIFWADNKNTNNHTNFKLSSSEEFIGLYSSLSLWVDSLSFDSQRLNVSQGRSSTNNTNWIYFSAPSPNAANTGATVAARTPKPIFSVTGGFYTSNVNLQLTSSISATNIYYTTDGSTPTTSSAMATGPIILSSTTVVKAIAYALGYISSVVVTNTYFINEHTFDLPVISFSTQSDLLFNPTTGIYEMGPNPGTLAGWPPYSGANYWDDIEIPVTFQMYDTSGNEAFSVDAGARIFGGYSRTHPCKSFAIYFRPEYGYSSLDYKIFKDKDIEEFQSIILRNGGSDFAGGMLRDAFAQNVFKDKMDLDYQEYQPTAVFINGEYWGIMDLREKVSEHFLESNHKDVDSDSVTILGDQSTPIVGTNTEYLAMRNYIINNDMSNTSNYNHVKTLMDIDNYIDYNIVQIYSANVDWPGGNIKFWKKTTADGLWRWILYDIDQTYNIYEQWGDCHNSLELATTTTGSSWPNAPTWGTIMLRQLLTNAEFRNRFIQRMAFHINTTYAPERQLYILDSIQAQIRNEMPFHLARWNDTLHTTMEDWEHQLTVITSFINNRNACFTDMMSDYFNLAGTSNLTIVNDSIKGKILLEDNKLPNNYSAPHFIGASVKIEANSTPNYEFLGWATKSSVITNETIIPQESQWAYLDNGLDQGTAWINSGFDDSGWNTSIGPLGYNETVINTVVSYGADANNKYPTTYFRKKVTLNNLAAISNLTLNLLMGDGVVIYINGVEAFRKNMPIGAISFNTLASTYASDAEEISYVATNIDKSYFVEGENIIAVEVHQSSVGSSDMSFDIDVITSTTTIGGSTIIPTALINFIPTGNDTLEAVYKNISPLIVTEINYNPNDLNNEFIELYNNGTKSILLTDVAITGDINFTFPDGLELPKHQYILIAKNLANFNAITGLKFAWTTGSLPNTNGDMYVIYNSTDTLDEVLYNSQTPWPILSSVNQTVVLKNTLLDNNQGVNWDISVLSEGSPGGSEPRQLVTDIYINEVMASNKFAYADEYGEYDDWIELYNASDEDINLEGLFVTDDLTNKNRYLIPSGYPEITTIEAKGYLILWADDQISQGPLHVNFNLEKSGENIALVQANYLDTTFIDIMAYFEIGPDMSFGRYSDGSEELSYQIMYTPGAANFNEINSIEVPKISINEICIYPNPVKDIVHIRSVEALEHVTIYNLNGNLLLEGNNTEIHVGFLPAGYYIAHLQTGNSSEYIHFIKLK